MNLFIVRYPETPLRVPDKGKATLGRADNNTVVLTEARVSRLHAQIEWRAYPGHFVVMDLGSSNGTYLNGEKIVSLDEYPVKNWDKIRIASTVLTIRFVENQSEIDTEFVLLRRRIHHQVTEVVKVADIQRIHESPAIAGDLTHLCPIELFQMLEVGQKTGELAVKSPLGDGHFAIKKGNIITARFGSLAGERAVYEALRCASGPFEFLPQKSLNLEPQITLPTTALLMEGCRLMDETSEAAKNN